MDDFNSENQSKKKQNEEQLVLTDSLVWTPPKKGDTDAAFTNFQHSLLNGGFVITSSLRLRGKTNRRLLTVARIDRQPFERILSKDETPLYNTIRSNPQVGELHSPIGTIVPQPGTDPGPSTTGGPYNDEVTFPDISCGSLNIEFKHSSDCENWLNEALNRIADPIENNPVRVLVFDTSPYGRYKDEFKIALQRFVQHPNPFVEGILASLQDSFCLMADEEFSPETAPSNSHETAMANHGIFIASIIRLIAPGVRIDIIPLATEGGIGTVERFARELQHINDRNIYQGEQLLVNFSSTSWIDVDALTHAQSGVLIPIEGRGVNLSDFSSTHFIDAEDWQTVANFGNQNRRIIAAAGNYDPTSGNAPWPGFPARVSGVLSVGAADLNGNRAYYSHLCRLPDPVEQSTTSDEDEPSDVVQAQQDYLESQDNLGQKIGREGILVSLATKHINGDPEKTPTRVTSRVNGLFVKTYFELGSEPENWPRNECGVAHWAGTSFATAIATGYMAKLCLAGMTAQEAYETMLALPANADEIPALITWQELVSP